MEYSFKKFRIEKVYWCGAPRYIIEGVHIEGDKDHWIKVAEITDNDYKLAKKIKETCEEYYGRRSN